MSMEFLGIIPSRYASTRFPGKPLALIGDKPMIQWVYERSSLALKHVFVATDDERIRDAVLDFGGQVIMTSLAHQSGTDRCMEATEKIEAVAGIQAGVIINIQGDEPFIRPEQIKLLGKAFDDPATEIATLAKPVENTDEIFDENKPKVVFDRNHFALYFSRSPIPFIRGRQIPDWFAAHRFYRHIGVYAYRKSVLQQIARLEPSELEKAESLEQLRWLANGFRIKVSETLYGPIGIDTPADLEKATQFLASFGPDSE